MESTASHRPWKTLRVSHSSHSLDDGDKLIHHVRGLYFLRCCHAAFLLDPKRWCSHPKGGTALKEWKRLGGAEASGPEPKSLERFLSDVNFTPLPGKASLLEEFLKLTEEDLREEGSHYSLARLKRLHQLRTDVVHGLGARDLDNIREDVQFLCGCFRTLWAYLLSLLFDLGVPFSSEDWRECFLSKDL